MKCKHCGDCGFVSYMAGDMLKVDVCGCVFKKGLETQLLHGSIKIELIEGGGVVLKAITEDKSSTKNSSEVLYVVTRRDLKKLIKQMKKTRLIMKHLGQK